VKFWKSFQNLNRSRSIGANGIQYRSSSVNVYHCCVHKTGSQWLRKILSDPIVFRHSALAPYHYQSHLPDRRDSRDIKDRTFAEPFPAGTIITPLYVSFDNFQALPKPEIYKAFFIQRDPRDIVVSWYFSMKYSHDLSGNVSHLRKALSTLSVDDGISYAMEHLHRSGHFDAVASWINASKRNSNVVVIRFEDMIGSASLYVFDALFRHCDICMPPKVLEGLLAKYSFEALAGRKPGEEKQEAHYRKGVHGDWKNYFDDALAKRFQELTDDLPWRLGYSVGSREGSIF
jgi:Sulfotransferase domain